MVIRYLNSTCLPDFIREFQESAIPLPGIHQNYLISSGLTLKMTDISPAVYSNLIAILKKHSLFLAESDQKSSPVLIAGLAGWHIIDELERESYSDSAEFVNLLKGVRNNLLKSHWEYHLAGKIWRIDAPLLMGILNITPDSFSDGGLFLRPEEAIDHAREMQEAGADIIDIGAESTRPGAVPVGQEEEWQRLFPVLQELKRQLDIPVSVDTYKAEIARRALEEGADIINDISGLRRDEAMAETVARHHCPLILMHMQGTPRDMQENPSYENLMEEIHLFFQERIEFAGKSGIEQLIIDPGLGFGKRYGDNYELLRRLRELRVFGYPLMVGPSRKSFIGKALGADADQRLMGTAAAVVMAVANGASILRVHDVPEMKQTLRIVQKIRQGKNF